VLLRLDCQQLRRTSFDLAFLLKSSSHCVDLSCYENMYPRLASTIVCSDCYVIIRFSPTITLPLSEYDCTVFLQIWTGIRSLPLVTTPIFMVESVSAIIISATNLGPMILLAYIASYSIPLLMCHHGICG